MREHRMNIFLDGTLDTTAWMESETHVSFYIGRPLLRETQLIEASRYGSHEHYMRTHSATSDI
jgi:hypothetical protein